MNFKFELSVIAVCLFLLGLVIGNQLPTPAAKSDRFEAGVIEGIRLSQKANEQAREESAIIWWSGSKDLSGARDRLCWNYLSRQK